MLLKFGSEASASKIYKRTGFDKSSPVTANLHCTVFCGESFVNYGRPARQMRTLYFLPCGFFFFPRLISAGAHWMSTILPHMTWP